MSTKSEVKNMAEYTIEQMKSAETLAQILAEIPEETRPQVIMMANSFLLGVQTQETLAANAATA
ncbi:MAG: hypothetical protein LUD16_12810 [Lachnospiraceae bacterium]|nr:hypothetical protein [Lachnospiraceae bacterium]